MESKTRASDPKDETSTSSDDDSSPRRTQKKLKRTTTLQKCTVCRQLKTPQSFTPNWAPGVGPVLGGMCYPCQEKWFGNKTTLLACKKCQRSLLWRDDNEGQQPRLPEVWRRLLERPFNNIFSSQGCPSCDGHSTTAGGELRDTDDEDDEQTGSSASISSKRICGECHQQKTRQEFSTTQWAMMMATDEIRDEARRHGETGARRSITYGQARARAFYSYSYSFYQARCLQCLPTTAEEFQLGVDENWRRDRAIAQALHRNFRVGIYDSSCMLSSSSRNENCRMAPPPAADLVGTYSVLYARVETESMPDGDHLSQRAVHTATGKPFGTLKLFVPSDAIDPSEIEYEQLTGTLNMADSTEGCVGVCSGEVYHFSFADDGVQGSELVGNCAEGTQDEGYENCRISIVSRQVMLDWIPRDDVSASGAYAQQMRSELSRRFNNKKPRPLLWLCNHKGLAELASQLVLEFMGPFQLSPSFALQPGDLWISIHVEYYSSSSEIYFLARPRSQNVSSSSAESE